MPLKTIKLSGFKSFVEPTTIPFAHNLTAIVGPNGCGKSNIIDAVRWVLGEISARQLRGDSMSDVIFNGSNNRKPVSQAAVELIFDNGAALLGGEYASYSEIAVRREVNREGSSDYYLNNVPCRRKDIIDLFLGTGLGIHSYAIIEQGMISGLIEAKPEELRLHLEEAAGVSKYKERRRETESRIGRCKENLARLNDIRSEIDNQLKALKKQSNVALVYKRLREKERLLKAKLQVLRWQDLGLRIKKLQESLQEVGLDLEKKLAQQREVEATIETLHQNKINLTEAYNETQANFYRLGNNINQLEQRIRYNEERKAQLSDDLIKLEHARIETEQHRVTDSEQVNLLEEESLNLAKIVEEVEKNFLASEETLSKAETEMNEWHDAWEKFNERSSHVAQRIEVEQNSAQHFRKTIEQESQLISKFESELLTLATHDLDEEISVLSVKDQDAQKRVDSAKDALLQLSTRITNLRTEVKNLGDKLELVRNRLQDLHGKKSALLALQKSALHGEQMKDWLKKNGLAERARLAHKLKVDAGWELAVEVVLGDYLEAICWDEWSGLTSMLPSLKDIPGGALTFFSDDEPDVARDNSEHHVTLASKVHASKSVRNILAQVYIAENLAEALKMRSTLKVHESVVTSDGIWLSAAWMRVPLKADQNSSILHRVKELKRLEEDILTVQKEAKDLEQSLQSHHQELVDLEGNQHRLQQEFHDCTSLKNDLISTLSVKKTHLLHMQKQIEQSNQEIANHKGILLATQEKLVEIEQNCQGLIKEKEENEEKRLILSQQRDQHRERLESSRDARERDKETLAQHKMRFELMRNQIEYLHQNLDRAQKQLTAFNEKREQIQKDLAEVTEPVTAIADELKEKLEQRFNLEKELSNAKAAAQEVEYGWQERERERLMQQEEVSAIRERLTALQVEKHGLEVTSANHVHEINELGFALDDLVAKILEEVESQLISETILEDKIAQTIKRVDRLGPINLAAIDEYNKQKERKDYLDIQNKDLEGALATLESAIRKIDGETRIKLESTFNLVNENLKNLFPKIFGGGKASLQLTSDGDLLESGVTIWAQPPGKRNATVHLLSGGEKALTAVALIFAIFQINPAPFCILDEVDAPFDDENIRRFCRLLKEMSPNVQFIYVSHNKLSMEAAHQLLGVTMQEPGVSRIVSVDIDRAMQLLET